MTSTRATARRGKLDLTTQHVIDGGVRQRGRLLRHRGNPQARGDIQRAGVGFNGTQDRRKQAGLAAAVAAGHANLPAIVQGGLDTGQQQMPAAAQREVVKGNHT